MMKPMAGALALIVLALPGMAQEQPACPTGAAGDWTWQARSGAIWIENPAFEVGWQTIGGEASTTGITLAASITPEEDVRSFRISFDAPIMFPIEREDKDGSTTITYLFGERGEYGVSAKEQGSRPNHNYYAVALTPDGETNRRLYASRVEWWEVSDFKIDASWTPDPGETIDWGFTTLETVKVGLATQHFQGGGKYNPNVGWDNVALTEAIDLTALPPLWEAARAASRQDKARASRTNQTCKWAY